MELQNRKLWQVGAGDTERDYSEICKKYDVMLAGPGKPGPYCAETYASFGDIRKSIRRFCVDAQKGDLVLLRIGTGRVIALGEIADDTPSWLPAFGDVDGWDLQHVRRVRWFDGTSVSFPGKTLGGQVRTFASVSVPAVRRWVQELTVPSDQLVRLLKPLPGEPPPLGRSELGRRLFIEGLPSDHVDRVMDAIKSLDRIAQWYSNELKRPEGRPSEHETVAYLVVPLLFSLGWSQQTAAIEWRNIDVALFSRMPTSDATLQLVVEAKLLGRSVFAPVGQAADYAQKPGRDQCTRLVVTDGIRYTVHEKTADGFRLRAYLNLLDMRDCYPALECGGAVDAILDMAR